MYRSWGAQKLGCPEKMNIANSSSDPIMKATADSFGFDAAENEHQQLSHRRIASIASVSLFVSCFSATNIVEGLLDLFAGVASQ